MKNRPPLLALLALAALFAQGVRGQQQAPPQSAQQQQPTPPAAPSPEPTPAADEVVRITTNLVQVDVVVTDPEGRQVTDLRPEEFEVLENGRPQQLTNFSYTSTQPSPAPAPSRPARTGGSEGPPQPYRPLRREEVRRTLVIVVDDIEMPFTHFERVRIMLRKFIDRQMRPGDLAAVVRTSGGGGLLLQQLTGDRAQLHAAVNRVQFMLNPPQKVSVNCSGAQSTTTTSGGSSQGGTGIPGAQFESMGGGGSDPCLGRALFGVSYGTLARVVFAMRGLPGRKAIAFVSHSFPVGNAATTETLQRLADAANRSSIAIHTINSSALEVIESAVNINDQLASLQSWLADGAARFGAQGGMDLIADLTGGHSMHDRNDLEAGVQRALDDLSGYYLIAYRPEETPAGAGEKFRKVVVRVKRPGLRVHWRKGFYLDPAAPASARAPSAPPLAAVLASPFPAEGVELQLTTRFEADQRLNLSVRSALHIDTRGLTFRPDGGDWHKAEVEILAQLMDGDWHIVDDVSKKETIRAPSRTVRDQARGELPYTLTLPVRGPGSYQLRVAVRDVTTGRTGTAYQTVRVPDLRKNRLALSGIFFRDPKGKQEARAAAYARHIPAGSPADFDFTVYNFRQDAATRRTQLSARVRVYREGQTVYEEESPLPDAVQKGDAPRLRVRGRVPAGANLPPGEYVLEVGVTDALSEEKNRTAYEWIDFRVEAKP